MFPFGGGSGSEDDAWGRRGGIRGTGKYQYGYGDYDAHDRFGPRRSNSYDADDEFSSTFSARGSLNQPYSFGAGDRNSRASSLNRYNSRASSRAERRYDPPRRGVGFTEQYDYHSAPEGWLECDSSSSFLPNQHEFYIRPRAEPQRNRPRHRRARDEGFFMSDAMLSPVQSESSRISRDTSDSLGHPLSNASRRRSGGENRRSPRRDGGSRAGGEQFYNDYARPHTYAGINAYRSDPFGAAYYGMWEGGREQRQRDHDRDRQLNDLFSRPRRPY